MGEAVKIPGSDTLPSLPWQWDGSGGAQRHFWAGNSRSKLGHSSEDRLELQSLPECLVQGVIHGECPMELWERDYVCSRKSIGLIHSVEKSTGNRAPSSPNAGAKYSLASL